jgi:hypothetical protein
MYEDMTPAELFALADQAEAMGRGLMQRAFDLRAQARNKQQTWGATVRPYVLIDKGASE